VIENHIIPQIKHKYDSTESTIEKHFEIKFKSNKRPSIYSLNKYIDQLRESHKIPLEITIHRMLPSIESPLKEPESRVSGAFVFLNNNPVILNNIDQLIRVLKENERMLVDSHQMMTLKKYQNDLDKLFQNAVYFVLCIAGIILLFIIVTFNLLLQTKMHDIGMMMAMGASSFVVRKLYTIEAFHMIFWPLCLSIATIICYNFYLPTFFITKKLILYMLTFSFIVTILAVVGAKFAVRHVVSQPPCKLISYRT
ncbi:membrane protein containing DUF214, permase predicted, partial [Candidatus Magnetomorum sp. HK-1]